MGNRLVKFNFNGYTLIEPEFHWDEPVQFNCRFARDNTCHQIIPYVRNEGKKGKRWKRTLDIGSQLGQMVYVLSEYADESVGAEIEDRYLELAEKGNEINKVKNVKFIKSNIYSNIKGKFDLIVSNPPFLFCPDDRGADWKYGYCGHLGLELQSKIIQGFDKHLAKNGEAIIIMASPVIAGREQVIDELKSYVSKRGYEIEVIEQSYYYVKELHKFYQEYNIDGFFLHFVHFKNNGKRKFIRKELPPYKFWMVKKLVESKKKDRSTLYSMLKTYRILKNWRDQ